MRLKQVFKTIVRPRALYNFKYSTLNPSHFPTATRKNTDNILWFTMWWDEQPIGVRFVNKGSTNKPAVEVTIYAKKVVDNKSIIKELAYRFEWNEEHKKIV